MSFLKEFKEFAIRGNVVDMAVGVIIGGAFGKIVTSLIDNVIMPPIGYAMGGTDFKNLKSVIQQEDVANKVAEVSIKYGLFIQEIVNFVVLAFIIFLMIRTINKIRTVEEPPAAPLTPSELLLVEIRDTLRKR